MSQGQATSKAQSAGQRAREAAKRRGRLQTSAAIPAIAALAGEAASQGLFSVDVSFSDPWFLDRTNQRELRRQLKKHDLVAVHPRVADGALVMSIAWGDFPPEDNLGGPKPVALRKPVILVINGTSKVGRAALRNLAPFSDLYTLRATSRTAPSAAVAAETPNVQWLSCDPASKDSLLAATRGVEKIFYVMPAVQNRADLARNVAAAAVANSVQYVVNLSIVGAQFRALHFARQCRDAEEAFEASGVPFTHLRCMGFFENVLGAAAGVKRGTYAFPMGTGSMAMLAVDDVGFAASRLLTRMGLEGTAVDLTGPELLTGELIAATLAAVSGHAVSYVSPPIEDWVAQLKGYGVETWYADGMGEFAGIIAKGMTTTVSNDVFGKARKMQTFNEWAARHRAAFQ